MTGVRAGETGSTEGLRWGLSRARAEGHSWARGAVARLNAQTRDKITQHAAGRRDALCHILAGFGGKKPAQIVFCGEEPSWQNV